MVLKIGENGKNTDSPLIFHEFWDQLRGLCVLEIPTEGSIITQNYRFRLLEQLECINIKFSSFMRRNVPKIGYFRQSQIFAHVRFSFFQISRKVKLLELRVVLSANINMHIPVILS